MLLVGQVDDPLFDLQVEVSEEVALVQADHLYDRTIEKGSQIDESRFSG